MKHSCLINGYDCLNLTKLDVLDGLAEIKIAVKYVVDGKELVGFPGSYAYYNLECLAYKLPLAADLGVLSNVDVTYITLPGWGAPITSITSFDALPDNCKRYISFIEDFLGVPIEWIGVGPERRSMLKK